MAKNSKRRRNGKLKKANIQYTCVNKITKVEKEVKIDKVILIQPKGAPKRNLFPGTILGKEQYKEARKHFYKTTPCVEKIIKRVKVLKVRVVKVELSDILSDEKRLKEIEKRYAAAKVYSLSKRKELKKSGKYKKQKQIAFEPMVTTIRLLKSKDIKRMLNHNFSKQKKAYYALKLKSKD